MAVENLAGAIAFEQEKRKRYADAAAKAQSPLATKLFASLAVKAIEHQLRLEAAHEGMSHQTWWEPGTQVVLGLAEVARKFVPSSDQTPLTAHLAGTDQVKALQEATEVTQQEIAMYDRFVAESSDEGEQALFAALRDEAREHLLTLEQVWRRLTH
ncbi:MAG: ferritin family protein [Betaproteobacteria bacterium]